MRIITDSQAVVRCLDSKTTKLLGSHSTFTIDELLEKINENSDSVFSMGIVKSIFHKILHVGNYGSSDFLQEINDILPEEMNTISKQESQLIFSKIRTSSEYSYLDFMKEFSGETVINSFMSGVAVSLLQPDGKGWKKGRLKMCFEFTPEEDESVMMTENLLTTHDSPLDEIRQLANISPIEEN